MSQADTSAGERADAERLRMEEALRENEALRLFVEYTPAAVAMFDRDMRYLLASRRFLRDWRVSYEDVIGRSHYDVFPEVPERWKEVHRRCLAGAVERCEEDPFPRQDGTLDWVRWEIHPWHTATGEIGGIILFSENITERKRDLEALRESEERFRLLVQGVRDYAIYMLAPDGTVKSWSSAAEQMFGYCEEEIVGQHRAIFFTEKQRRAGRPERDLEMAVRDGLYEEEDWRVRKGGSRFWANVVLTALRDDAGNLRGFANVTRDFTQRKGAEEALRESEEKYVAIHDKASFGIALTKLPERTFFTVNDAFLRLVGFTREEVIGRTSEELGISDPHSQEEMARELQRRGSVRDFEVTRRTKSGAPIVLSTSLERVTIGGSDFVLTTIQDVTERKRAETALRQKEAELEVILDRTPFMLTRCSRDLRYRYVSRAYAEMIGRTPEEVAGMPIVEVIGEEAFHAIRPRVEAVLRGQLVQYEDEVHFSGVGARILHVIYVPDLDERGQVIGWVANIVDVTEQRQAEALRVANTALVEADRNRTEFLAMLSHELRNPLAPIRNSLYLLERAAPGGEQARRALGVIDRQVVHMTRLIDDLLDVTRIVRGKVRLQRERLDLNDLVQRTAEDHRTLFVKSDVRLEVLPAPAEIPVDGDRIRLAQTLGNLLQNAAKFTPRGGKATVSIQADPARGQAILTVRDTGTGIEPEMLPRLFHPFTQADATLDRSKGGLGLGLALVKGLVEMHGGSVSAASSGPGTGAAFTIRLPLDATVARTLGPRAAGGVARAARRVLVIEDNEDAADTLRDVLELGGHVVEVAYTGHDGVEKARAFRPDVVLCDIGLPGMDGYEVARTMRADPELARAALVAVTGYAQPEDVAMAKNAGFDAHLAKPPTVERLERVMADVERAGDERLEAS